MTCTRKAGIIYMIKSFADKETEKIYNQQHSRVLPEALHAVALRKLMMIDAAKGIDDLKVPPGNRLEKLSGNREGQYSIRINEKYRICMTAEGEEFLNVEIVDYHKG